jgi:hypothetical protein
MKTKNYTTSFTAGQSPDEIFNVINNVRGSWSEEIGGSTDILGVQRVLARVFTTLGPFRARWGGVDSGAARGSPGARSVD